MTVQSTPKKERFQEDVVVYDQTTAADTIEETLHDSIDISKTAYEKLDAFRFLKDRKT